MGRHKLKLHPGTKKELIKPVRKSIEQPPSTQEYKKLQSELRILRQQMNDRIDKVEQEPKNIIIIGDETMFKSLTNKFGSDEKAMEFLLSNIKPERNIDIVNKLYLEGIERNRYPIACTDGYRFRYLNRSGKIVDDKGGRKIVSKLESEIHCALVEANSKLLKDAEQHCMIYNIESLQNQIYKYRALGDHMKFREVLAKTVYNEGHPFFN